jgi:zinc D-Ala-D-Ala carboxypeptidase
MGQAEGLMDWSAYPNFTRSEFVCRCGCGRADMQPGFMSALQMLRDAYARPMPVSSGYRCPNHPKEAAKATPGAHASGCAADVAVHGSAAHELLRLAFHFGFTGIGVQQRGDHRFIHLDTLTGPNRPMVWSYP